MGLGENSLQPECYLQLWDTISPPPPTFLRFRADALWKGPHFWLGKITLHGSWFICFSRWQMAKHKHKKREPWLSNEKGCHNKETTKHTFLTLPSKLLLCSVTVRDVQTSMKSVHFIYILQRYTICLLGYWARGFLKMSNCGFIVQQKSAKSLHLLFWVKYVVNNFDIGQWKKTWLCDICLWTWVGLTAYRQRE